MLYLALLATLITACGDQVKPILVYITPTAVPPTEHVESSLVLASHQQNPALIYLQQGATPSPTPGSYGPIIVPTSGAPAITPTPTVTVTVSPGAITMTPTITPTVTITPTIGATATLSGTPLPTLEADILGLQINTDISDDDYAVALWHAQNLGLTWVKFQFAWDLMEPEQGVMSETAYRYRLFVQRARENGFKIMVSIAKAPDWARNSAEEDGPPRDPQLLANFISQFLGLLRTDILGKSYIDAIEVWNEPNLRREWNGGTLSGAEYMRYFDAAYNAIRAAEGGPGILVISAGLAPTGVNDGIGATDDRAYFRQMYDAGLNNPAYQNIAIGIHPYGAWNPPDARCCLSSGQGYDDHPSWFFLDTIEDYHNIMGEYGDTTRQLWVTEFGWGTYDNFYNSEGTPAAPPADPPYFSFITETEQANYVMRAFEIGQNTDYIAGMILWNLNFAVPYYVDTGDERAGYSIIGTMPDPERFAYTLIWHAPKTTPTP
jgi:hypothetical protein